MLISKAMAASGEAASTAADAAANSAGAGEAFMMNMLMLLIIVILFWILLIMPQQKRYKKHNAMLKGIRKGDKVLTAGGFIGTVDKITEGSNEIVIDLGNKVKVTALRSTIQTIMDENEA